MNMDYQKSIWHDLGKWFVLFIVTLVIAGSLLIIWGLSGLVAKAEAHHVSVTTAEAVVEVSNANGHCGNGSTWVCWNVTANCNYPAGEHTRYCDTSWTEGRVWGGTRVCSATISVYHTTINGMSTETCY